MVYVFQSIFLFYVKEIFVQNSFYHEFDKSKVFGDLYLIGHVLNEQGTGYESIFSWCEYSISIELKMGHVI